MDFDVLWEVFVHEMSKGFFVIKRFVWVVGVFEEVDVSMDFLGESSVYKSRFFFSSDIFV